MTFLYTVLGILVFILVLGVAVIIHEGGHFFFAKKAGILCHEFSIGMGPCIFQKKKGETMYSFRAIPIGGYVSMAGEEVEYDVLKGYDEIKLELDENNRVKTIVLNLDNPKYQNLPTYKLGNYDLTGTMDAKPDELFIEVSNDEGTQNSFIVNRDAMLNYKKKEEIQIAPTDRVFTNKPLGKRFMSVFAGPMMNFVLALFIFFLMGVIFGYPDTKSTTVEIADGPVSEVGVESGDTINAINDTELTTWNDLTVALNKISTGEGLNEDGSIFISYFDSKENQKVEQVKVWPNILIFSMDMMIDNRPSNNGKPYIMDLGENMSESKVGKAGILGGDLITKLNNVEINSAKDVLAFFTSSEVEKASKVKITIERQAKNEDEQGEVTPEQTANVETQEMTFEVDCYSLAMLEASNLTQTKVQLGVSVSSKFDFVKLLYMPWVETGKSTMQIFKTLGLFFKKGAGVHITDLSGPVGIANLFINLVKGPDAFYQILYWTGLLSVNLGFVNLLPLPALDGGRLVFLAYEGITKKKANAKVENTIHNIGFMLFMALFVFIFISDIIKCF